MQIPCRHGHISPAGWSSLLPCSVNTRIPGPAAGSTQQIHPGNNYTKALRDLVDDTRFILFQDGDDGISIEFDVADFEVIAAILKPKLKRRLSSEQRAKAIENLRPFQISSVANRSLQEF